MGGKAYDADETLPLWEDGGIKKITLRNRRTGERFTFSLSGRLAVGRDKERSDLRITEDDRFISGRHLEFSRGGSDIYVEDAGSLNGTRLNGKSLQARTRIRNGDVLQMGHSEFEVIFEK